jgi:hypothetical protein
LILRLVDEVPCHKTHIDLCDGFIGFEAPQVNHGGLYVPMAKPSLERTDVDPMSQMLGGKRVPKFLDGKMLAIRALIASVAIPSQTFPAVQPSLVCRTFNDF